MAGGKFKPKDCLAKDKIALVVPMRDREDQLQTFLAHIHPFLQRQNIEYQIFVVTQVKRN